MVLVPEKKKMMKQRQISIMGDSISTCSGYNPKGYAVYYDIFAKTANRMRSVRDCWWWIVLRELRAKLCVNGSFSGSMVCGEAFPAGESEERVSALQKNGKTPDLIMIYMGFNDYACGISPERFATSYGHMLEQMRKRYPQTVIVFGTLMRPYLQNSDWAFPEVNRGVRLSDYDTVIREVSACKEGVYLVDLAKCRIKYETLDGAHPTVKGHKEIAEAWKTCLKYTIMDW